MIPRATIRLQFSRDFTLDDAVEWVPYFRALGISHLYASPLLAARGGSTHGYDVTDPTEINPELGGYAALTRLHRALQRHDMGLILDIVPNHMAADAANPWWWDVLLWGQASRYGEFFDIDWEDRDLVLRSRVLLPVLGDSLEACFGRGELRLDVDDAAGAFVCRYFDAGFPIDPRSVADVIDGENGGWHGLAQAARQLQNIPAGEQHTAAAARLQSDLADRLRVARPSEREQLLAPFKDTTRLRALLEKQNYVLAPWQDAASRINWRRFFDINGLVALRADREAVFDAYHRLTLDLVRDGIVDGLRVDHVDGMADPAAYCRRLRAALAEARPGEPTYLLVEKILDKDEVLEKSWPVQGTTGYDFMDQVAAVLHDPAGEAVLNEIWQRVSGDPRDFAAMARDARREMLDRLFPKQLDALMAHLPEGGEASARPAMIALLTAMQRYRTYGDGAGMGDTDRDVLAEALRRACAEDPSATSELDRIGSALESPANGTARQRFQQLSATLTAKAVEDTGFYRYSRLLSRNEVGSDPGRLAITPAMFHADCSRRRADFPEAMLATATHDHKRGEDNRARLAVLSEIAGEWRDFVAPIMARSDSVDPAIRYMIVQSVIGAWPLSFAADDATARNDLRRRLEQWLTKALREAKQASSWAKPDAAFEAGCMDFLHRLLEPGSDTFGPLAGFIDRIAPSGALNSLSQVMLRLTTPGVPDLYRGTEFWDFSLVDPDNRAPVDFAARRAALDNGETLDTLLPDWRSGRIKQALIARLLAFRRVKPRLFAESSYAPLTVTGKCAGHLLGFVRRAGDDALVVLVPRLCARGLGRGDLPVLPSDFWEDTRVELPAMPGGENANDLLSNRTLPCAQSSCVGRVLDRLSIAALHIPGR
jgi:(1->4)-alpha-D-glucan 1-alpha-D-glucosylmutase